MKGKREYCLIKNVGTNIARNAAVLTAGSWSCIRSAVQHGRQHHHTLLLYIFVELFRVFCIEILASCPSWSLREEVYQENNLRS